MPPIALRRPPVGGDRFVAADGGEHALAQRRPRRGAAEELDDAGLDRGLHLRQREPRPGRQDVPAEVAVDPSKAGVPGQRPLRCPERPLQTGELRRQRILRKRFQGEIGRGRPCSQPNIEIAIGLDAGADVEDRGEEQRVAVDLRAEHWFRLGAQSLAQAPAVARHRHTGRPDGDPAVATQSAEDEAQRLHDLLQPHRRLWKTLAAGKIADQSVPSAADRLLRLQQLFPQTHGRQPKIARTTSCSPVFTSALSLKGSTSAVSTASAGAIPAAIRLAQ